MNENTSSAEIKRNHTFLSPVWLIPLIALLTGAWLLISTIRNAGPEITLYIDNAEGIEVNNTTVRILDVNVGRITNIRLRPNGEGVQLTAKLSADAKNMIREDTKFWIVKPRIDQKGISAISTLVSGVYIAFTPGKSEKPADTFTVSDTPPLIENDHEGVRLYLSGSNTKMIDSGSPVLYENFNVGVVESARFDPDDHRVHYTILIRSPNQKLINKKTRFWLQSGINLSANSSGVKVDAPPLPAILSGAITFKTPKSGQQTTQTVANGDHFELYNDRNQAENLPDERSLYYVVFFNQSVNGLTVGAPVRYKGLQIGTVSDVPFFSPNDSLKIFQNNHIPVRIQINPSAMEWNAKPQSKQYWETNIQAALNRGLHATLTGDNLLLGSKLIELNDADQAKLFKPEKHYNGYTVIASANGGLDQLQEQITRLVDKLNHLPLEKTVGELNGSLKELRATLKSANALLSQPQTKQLPQELSRTLNDLRHALQGISPQSPLYRDAQKTIGSLNRALQDAQPLLNTLQQQPNALIFNSSITDPTPKGSRP